MKEGLGEEEPRLRTLAEMAAHAQKMWNAISKGRLSALIDTMEQRVKDLVSASGGYK
jgi:hypothetical protein